MPGKGYDFKVKTGFFKTQDFILKIAPEGITLEPREEGMCKGTFIPRNELDNLYLTRRDQDKFEIEIKARGIIYSGTLIIDGESG
ncbi:MAG: hypothetical protein D5R97_00330 [Candidatus Syntrophonatronum acetioxidans]|uniref:Uncharacterized protein n=1 Tax=Candidatus Syntrophonatronum acetioxidans TaxID=1795816 RepID=A0A424YIX2_9FIRM|nr:MAG: hypothetical protein D5R97_00330 [Candidatus Syntrophonatronum acetioxidans]